MKSFPWFLISNIVFVGGHKKKFKTVIKYQSFACLISLWVKLWSSDYLFKLFLLFKILAIAKRFSNADWANLKFYHLFNQNINFCILIWMKTGLNYTYKISGSALQKRSKWKYFLISLAIVLANQEKTNEWKTSVNLSQYKINFSTSTNLFAFR